VLPDLSQFGNSGMVDNVVGACNNSRGKKVKVTFNLEQATKAEMGSRGIAILLL
jgi:hypothetical protein